MSMLKPPDFNLPEQCESGRLPKWISDDHLEKALSHGVATVRRKGVSATRSSIRTVLQKDVLKQAHNLVRQAKTEGWPYPVFIEDEDALLGVKNIGLRIGNPKPGETQKTSMTLTQTRLLAYSLLREVEEREAQMERLNEEARSLEHE
jgi:hypothetical protein